VRHLAVVLVLVGACRPASPPLRLGTTYTVQQSGALAVLESLWTARGTAPLATVIGPSGQILRAAANGDLDAVITHAPALEEQLLVAPGHALLRCPLAASRFAVVGPATDPAHVATAATAAEAFRRIATAGGPFVSRGDSSGTHLKELALWRGAGVTPAARWYLESGADQATTLHLADERAAYALADLPTYARLAGLASRILFAADTALTNPYTLYVIRRTAAHPAAGAFATWAAHSGRDALLALRLSDGTPAFVPRAGDCTPPGVTPPGDRAPRAEPRPTQSPAQPSGAALLGRWEYVAPPRSRPPARPSLDAGLQVSLELDSAAGPTAYGRVGRWFAGDMGVRPAAFGPVTAQLGDSGRVTITIPATRPDVAAVTVLTTRRGDDTLAIMHSARGNDAGPFAEGPGARFVRTSSATVKP
jgi:tungstate transport system substrate-binding protein